MNRVELRPRSEARAFTYNVYRGELSALDGMAYGTCREAGLEQNSWSGATDDPLPGQAWFYIVTGANPAGEGPMGRSSSGDPRTNVTPCAP